MKNYHCRYNASFEVLLFASILLLFCQCNLDAEIYSTSTKIKLDQEHKLNNKAINSSTQSINRYSSNLRKLTTANFDFNKDEMLLNVSLKNEEDDFIALKNVDVGFVVPLLPYEGRDDPKFDIANIILAEYSRNGISIPIQKANEEFASIDNSAGLFNSDGEYFFKNNEYKPNPGVLPKRINLVNNCLRPRLWEMSANDAVGEMYHAWLELDDQLYKQMLSAQTGLSQEKIPNDFNNPSYFEKVAINFDKLRKTKSSLGTFEVNYNAEKELGSYSSQDSRRKVQRKFYDIKRDTNTLKVKLQSELKDGDIYSMFSFEEPGIYNPKVRTDLVFKRQWTNAEVSFVAPLTFYSEDQDFFPSDYLEIILKDENESEAIVIGNIPMSLLSFKNDFVIPSFGAGVLLSSELIERRLLRKQKGPHPSFAYLTKIDGDNHYIQNNHLTGLEQIFLRPIQKEDGVYLRCTIVSYERITDLIELDIKIPPLKDTFFKNHTAYSPPIFETYQDDNTL